MTTDPHTHTHRQTHRQDRSQYTAPLSLACSVTNSRRRLLLSVIQPTAQRTRGVDPGKVGVLTPDGMVSYGIVEFNVGARCQKSSNDGATRQSKKF